MHNAHMIIIIIVTWKQFVLILRFLVRKINILSIKSVSCKWKQSFDFILQVGN
jgi:hypothetical protein